MAVDARGYEGATHRYPGVLCDIQDAMTPLLTSSSLTRHGESFLLTMPVLKSGKQVNKLKNCTHILNLLPSQRARLVEERISDCTVFFRIERQYVEQRRNYRLVSCVLLMHSAGNSCDKIITSVSNPNCIPCLSFVQLLSN